MNRGQTRKVTTLAADLDCRGPVVRFREMGDNQALHRQPATPNSAAVGPAETLLVIQAASEPDITAAA
jgi:hypothetical protein